MIVAFSVYTHFLFDSIFFFADIFDITCFQIPSDNVRAVVFCTTVKQVNIICGYGGDACACSLGVLLVVCVQNGITCCWFSN